MKIAVVGCGVSGLLCAYLLGESHDVTLYERDSRLGGHANTVDVTLDGRTFPVDTGFIVFNPARYPGLVRLLNRLDVRSVPTRMSFSVRCDRTGLEYGGATLSGLFARRRNVLDPGFLRMLSEIRCFGLAGERLLGAIDDRTTVGEHLRSARYSRRFIDQYLVPMGASIWSMPPERFADFPLRALLNFFHNHGMLRPWKPPQWRTIEGGSRRYVDAIAAAIRARGPERIRLGVGVESIERRPEGVRLRTSDGVEDADEVILATHSDQSLAMLTDASAAERETLSAIAYQPNDAVLHTDASILPRRRAAWSGWNYHAGAQPGAPVAVTYLMNALQPLPTETPVCVTLNAERRIDPAKIIARFRYHHPQYNAEAFAAQRRHAEISAANRTHYCGAYWGYGFHEDGVQSALRVCAAFGAAL